MNKLYSFTVGMAFRGHPATDGVINKVHDSANCDRNVIAIDFKLIKCHNAHIIMAKGLSQPNTNIYWVLVASMLYMIASACLGYCHRWVKVNLSSLSI